MSGADAEKLDGDDSTPLELDAEDTREVFVHIESLRDRFREIEVLEATLRDAMQTVRRTRTELSQTLGRLERLRNERRAAHEPSFKKGAFGTRSVRKAGVDEPAIADVAAQGTVSRGR